MKSLLKDPDIARLFENTFPNTLGDSVESFVDRDSRIDDNI